MTGPPGTGGTPPPPAGYIIPGMPDVAAGTKNIIRARLVIVSGTGANTGLFVYSGIPGPGNKPLVAITTNTTDPYGNTIQPSDSTSSVPAFIVLGTAGSYLQAAVQSGLASLIQGTGDASENKPGLVTTQVSGAGGTRQLETFVSSPQFVTGVPADIALFSTSFDGTVNSSINLDCANRVNFGVSQAAFWADGTQQLSLPAGGGPFIFGETFHNVSLAANWSGTFRVKKLPWNAVLLDVELNGTANTSGGVSVTFGALPDATYYPTIQRHFPLSMTGAFVSTSGSFAGNVRLRMPTSGGVVIEIPTLAASALLTLACSVMYPTN